MVQLYENEWVTNGGAQPLGQRCSDYVEVTEDDVFKSVTVVPKLETLIMMKQMLKRNTRVWTKKDQIMTQCVLNNSNRIVHYS